MKLIQTSLVAFLVLMASQSYASTTQIDSTYFAAGTTTVTFETGVSQVLPDVAGVQFVQEVYPSNFFGTAGGGLFGVMGFINTVGDPYGTPRWSDLAVNFTTPVSAVGGWIGNIWNFLDSHESLVSVSVFDTDHNLLAERDINLLGLGNAPVFFGFASSESIGRIEWNGQNGGFFAVDNLMFNQASAVPDPSVWTLLCAGLIVMRLIPKRMPSSCALPS
jgi:hypothetical protein